MLSNIQKKVIIRAVRIRVANGEELDDILKSYTKLTDSERDEIRVSLGSK